MPRINAPQLPLPGAQVSPTSPAFVLEPEHATQTPGPDLTAELFSPADLRRPPAQDMAAWLKRQPAAARAKFIADARRRLGDHDPD